MLSNTCKYALRSIIYLAINNKEQKKIGIKKIAEDLNIPTPFLGKILQNLVRQKILKSTKGPNGGFIINEKTYNTTLMEIVEIIDGDSTFQTCVLGVNTCSENIEQEHPCPVHHQLSTVKSQLVDFFQSKTILQLINDIDSFEEIIKL